MEEVVCARVQSKFMAKLLKTFPNVHLCLHQKASHSYAHNLKKKGPRKKLKLTKLFPCNYKSSFKNGSYSGQKQKVYIHHQHYFLFHSCSARQLYPDPISDLLCQTSLSHMSSELSICRPLLLCSDQSCDNGLGPLKEETKIKLGFCLGARYIPSSKKPAVL